MKMKHWFGFGAGISTGFALCGLHQDSFGGLENYCAYLRNGHWVDGRLTCVIFLGVNALTMLLLSLMPDGH